MASISPVRVVVAELSALCKRLTASDTATVAMLGLWSWFSAIEVGAVFLVELLVIDVVVKTPLAALRTLVKNVLAALCCW